ncbi:MAG: 50S ribosomal protein L11 methyltransferase [Odoribacter sp.]
MENTNENKQLNIKRPMKYIEVTFTLTPYIEAISEAIMAELGTIGYDGFAYTETGFIAYIPAKDFNEQAIHKLPLMPYLSEQCKIDLTHQEMEDRDWNEVWEETFTPIVVDNKILVRAGFHDTIPGIEYEIIIEPKMSFGTGHHATTALMLRMILHHLPQLKGKRILDMGCGTGILAIMAAKAGAAEITGIDIDEWAYHNAIQNIQTNHLQNIIIKIGDAALLKTEKSFDLILANINRNILLNDMPHYIEKLNSKGYLIMSGFYLEDLRMIREKAEQLGLTYENSQEDNHWVSVSFYKK